MKTLMEISMMSALLFLPPLATASVYSGSWENKTFDTTGALTIDFTVKKSSVSGSFDFDGPVFGAGDPPAIAFKAQRKANGSGSFKVTGTAVGDLAGSFTPKGKLTITITNIPGGFLSEARINGKFDLGLEKFDATYEIDDNVGLFANGVAEAHVPKAPTLKAVKKVAVSGNGAKTQLKVLTNTGIASITTSINGTGKVIVKGSNPYQIVIRNMTGPSSKVTVTVTNDDGFASKKTIRFTKAGSSALQVSPVVE